MLMGPYKVGDLAGECICSRTTAGCHFSGLVLGCSFLYIDPGLQSSNFLDRIISSHGFFTFDL